MRAEDESEPVAQSVTQHIDPEPPRSAETAAGGQPSTEMIMNKDELKKQHPELYAAVLEEGRAEVRESVREEALTDERDRVEAHLTAGESSGDMKTAIEAIRAGDKMTQTHITKYTMAAANRGDRQARQAETEAAAQVVDTAGVQPAEPEDLGDAVVAKLAATGGL